VWQNAPICPQGFACCYGYGEPPNQNCLPAGTCNIGP